jgi:hypothetical protein
MQLTLLSDEDSEGADGLGESDAEEQGDLADMADSDVCGISPLVFCFVSVLLFPSALHYDVQN